MTLNIEDSIIEDMIRDALDSVDIVGNVDVEEIVADEIGELNLLEGINVEELVKSAIKDSVENSGEFDEFMKMKKRVEDLESSLESALRLFECHSSEIDAQHDMISIIKGQVFELLLKANVKPWWMFWV